MYNMRYEHRRSNLLVFLVASFSVSFAYVLLYGVSGRGLVFMYTFQLLCYALYMTTTVDGRERVAMWALVCLHVLLVGNQLHYMSYENNFIIFFSVVAVLLTSWIVLSGMVNATNLYREHGEDVSDLQSDRIYLVIKRPKTLRDFFTSLTGSMKDSVSYSIGYDWIKYSEKNGRHVILRSDLDFYGCSFFDTGLTVTESQKKEFQSLVGVPKGVFESCLAPWKYFLDGTEFEPKPFELTPTSYLKRVLPLTLTFKKRHRRHDDTKH